MSLPPLEKPTRRDSGCNVFVDKNHNQRRTLLPARFDNSLSICPAPRVRPATLTRPHATPVWGIRPEFTKRLLAWPVSDRSTPFTPVESPADSSPRQIDPGPKRPKLCLCGGADAKLSL